MSDRQEHAQGAVEVRDPLESVRNTTLGFGVVLILVSAVGVVRRLISDEPVQDADIWKAWAFLAVIALAAGPMVSFVRIRMRHRSLRAKNAGTGIVAGIVYASAGMSVAGEGMPPQARVGLGLFVAGMLAWAVASALNQASLTWQAATSAHRPRKRPKRSQL